MDLDNDPYPIRVNNPWTLRDPGLTKFSDKDQLPRIVSLLDQIDYVFKKQTEAVEWCNATFDKNWSLDKYGFMFQNETDASLFILKFCTT